MSRAWKPGDVAMVGEFTAIVVGEFIDCPDKHPREPHWHRSDGDWNRLDVYGYRPLVVIDPEPPKPEEPQGLGAVVEDAEGIALCAKAFFHFGLGLCLEILDDARDVLADAESIRAEARIHLSAAAALKAEVWDEGYHRGALDESRELERADNPYDAGATS